MSKTKLEIKFNPVVNELKRKLRKRTYNELVIERIVSSSESIDDIVNDELIHNLVVIKPIDYHHIRNLVRDGVNCGYVLYCILILIICIIMFYLCCVSIHYFIILSRLNKKFFQGGGISYPIGLLLISCLFSTFYVIPFLFSLLLIVIFFFAVCYDSCCNNDVCFNLERFCCLFCISIFVCFDNS